MRTAVRKRPGDGGFTLVELLVVIVVIGVLAAIALPNLVRKKERAYDASLERALRDAATAQEAWSDDAAGGYTTSVDDLRRQGFRETAEIRMSMRLVPGGYCIEATRPGAARPLYMTNAGPAAGKPTDTACA